ncbi:MAG: hypothetical protein GX070_04325 [Alcaligenaceae bacterium]|nr:hypothetical protein [Alcaligenaceae bacterium]
MTDFDQQNATPDTTDQTHEFRKPRFSNGGFVIGLIVFGLFTALITWSVSFVAMFFGAIGSVISIACCLFDHAHCRFTSAPAKNQAIEDENWAYFAIRAVFGAIFGTAAYVIVFQNAATDTPWAAVATVAAFAGLLFDKIIFKK